LDDAARRVGPRTRALVPVHLYGQALDAGRLGAWRRRFPHVSIVEDCAQGHGARSDGRHVGTLGEVGAFSFYPTKNLGALGDGGLVVTDRADLAERLRRLRNYGQADRYHHVEPGWNSRLDELQAALLRVKLPGLEAEVARRRELAGRYLAGLSNAHV